VRERRECSLDVRCGATGHGEPRKLSTIEHLCQPAGAPDICRPRRNIFGRKCHATMPSSCNRPMSAPFRTQEFRQYLIGMLSQVGALRRA